MIEQKDPQNKTRKPLLMYYGIALVAVLLLNMFVFPLLTQTPVSDVSYNEFMRQVEAKTITKVEIDETQILYSIKGENGIDQFYRTGRVDDPELVNRLTGQGIEFSQVIPKQPNILFSLLLTYGLPILMFIAIGQFFRKSVMNKVGGAGLAFGEGKTGKIYVPSSDRKSFADVAGQDEAKESLLEIVDYLAHPRKYMDIGAKCPKGILLVGPPGTGKTLLAKAVAGEAKVPFFSISGSEFVEMFVGRGAAKVRQLFEEANKKAPCIVFIDEIDTIGKRRDVGIVSNDEREQTLNQLLSEMDGFEDNNGVVILAATNRPEVLDPALLRPGRFDRQVRVELPDLQGRIDILKVHAARYQLAGDVDFPLLARATAGASGAQLANIINEGALRAVRLGHGEVTQADLEESIETVIAGQQKKNNILSEHEKKIVAYHEIGHALVAVDSIDGPPVHKITIVPRTSGALGYTMQVDRDEKTLITRAEALHRIATLCGGRAAEELVFGEYTTGAANDIQQATAIARDMVTKYGMSDAFGMMALETEGSRYLGGGGQAACSPETARLVDQETLKIIRQSQDKASQILKNREAKMHELAKFLLERETISGEEFMDVLNRQS